MNTNQENNSSIFTRKDKEDPNKMTKSPGTVYIRTQNRKFGLFRHYAKGIWRRCGGWIDKLSEYTT